MARDPRGNYSRSAREGARLRRVYLGKGMVALLAAGLDRRRVYLGKGMVALLAAGLDRRRCLAWPPEEPNKAPW